MPSNELLLILLTPVSLLTLAGFAMQEAGMVRAGNAAASCLKHITMLAVTGIFFMFIGSKITGGGTSTPLYIVLAAITTTIPAGAMAERARLWPFLLFTAVLTGLIFPFATAFTQGWLARAGFHDFAGASFVHILGSSAALTGTIILGPRLGKYRADKTIRPPLGSNLPLAALGAFLIWAGWLGLYGAAALVHAPTDPLPVLQVAFTSALLAASAGGLSALLTSILRFGKQDLTLVINGAVAGLVAISGCADLASPFFALLTGAVGGVLCSLAVTLFDKYKIDDVTGGLSVHLVGGIWGSLATALFCTGHIFAQLAGILTIGLFANLSSALVWLTIKRFVGLRCAERDEYMGLDRATLGLESYPDFEIRRAG